MTNQVPTIGRLFGGADITTFMGLPTCTDLAELSAEIALLGIRGATPYPSAGAYCAGPSQVTGSARRDSGTCRSGR